MPMSTLEGEAAVNVHFCVVLECAVGGSPQKNASVFDEGKGDQQCLDESQKLEDEIRGSRKREL